MQVLADWINEAPLSSDNVASLEPLSGCGPLRLLVCMWAAVWMWAAALLGLDVNRCLDVGRYAFGLGVGCCLHFYWDLL